MSDVEKIPKNGYKVVSTFSGCGGSSMGYKLAGYDVLCSVEFIPEAATCYRANFPGTYVFEVDVRDLKSTDIMDKLGLKKGELDILDGSPPCCSFSLAGIRDKGWNKVHNYSSTKQRVDDLFFEYARLVRGLMPKVFIAENTKGLTMGKSKDVLTKIIKLMDAIGYNAEYKVLDASKYGVPQQRERCIIMGVRKDLGLYPVYPEPLDTKITTEQAIGDLIENGTDLVENDQRYEYIKQYIHAGYGRKEIEAACEKYGISVFMQSYLRDKWNTPYRTLVQSNRFYHPVVDRLLSCDEGKRLQTFPDDFILNGTPQQNWERLGRAVPPNLMKAISDTVRCEILDKVTHEDLDSVVLKNNKVK